MGLVLGMTDYYKLMLWLDKRYSLAALDQSELGSFTSCPIRVCDNRSPLVGVCGRRDSRVQLYDLKIVCLFVCFHFTYLGD